MNGVVAATAELIAALGTTSLADRLIGLAASAIVHDAAALILFSEDSPPIVAVDRLKPAERGYLYGDYISGVYLLSPFYRLAKKGPLPRAARIRDIAPEGFPASEYYRRYFSRIGVADLMGVLIPAGKGITVFMSLSRSTGHKLFSAMDVRQLENLMPVMVAAVKRHMALPDATVRQGRKNRPSHATYRRARLPRPLPPVRHRSRTSYSKVTPQNRLPRNSQSRSRRSAFIAATSMRNSACHLRPNCFAGFLPPVGHNPVAVFRRVTTGANFHAHQ